MQKHIVVIGSGPAGYPAALKAASLGAKVTVVEKSAVGGVCLNCGCIPSKSLLDAAHRFDVAASLSALSQEAAVTATPDWGKISARRAEVIKKLQGGILNLFKAAKIDFVQGEAKFLNFNEIEVKNGESTQKLSFDAAIIAAGTHAFLPKMFEEHYHDITDNSTIFDLPAQPKTLTIVGGGVIGCEFASMFSALGTKVTIVEMMPALVPGEDETSVRILTNALKKRGVEILVNKTAKEFKAEGSKKILTLESGEVLESDCVLVAVGREAHLGGLGLENLGIGWTRRGVEADPQTMQIKDNIYAAGDITGMYLLAHAAMRQGEVAASNIMGVKAVYHNSLVPRAMFTTPEVASIGLNKKTAEAAGRIVKLHRAFYAANGRAMTQSETDGQLQIFADADTGLLLGASIAGANASELIHIFSVALNAGMTTAQLKEVIFAHPTLSELVTEALAK